MQVPAYWPVVDGVQLAEKRVVLWELKKVIIMEDIGIIVVSEDEGIDIVMLSRLGRKAKMGENVCRCFPFGYAHCHSKGVEVLWVYRYGKVF